MKAAALFPQLLTAQTSGADTSAWNVELNFDTKTDVQRLLTLINEAAQHAANIGGMALLKLASGLGADVVTLSGTAQIPRPTLMLLRLLAASLAIDGAAHLRQFSIVRDWILFAIRGKFTTDQAIELDDLSGPQQAVLESSSATADFVRIPFLIWAWGLFYYARVTGDLKTIAASYLTFVESVCKAKQDETSIETLVYAGTWAVADGDSRGKTILQRLAVLLDKISLPKNIAIQLSVALSAGVGERAGLDTVQLAESALAKFNADLNAFDRLQLIAHACSGSVEKIVARLPELENAIRNHWSFVHVQTQGGIHAIFERERSFDIIAPLVCTLASSDHVPEAVRLVCVWRSGKEVLNLPRTAILLPTWHKGTTFVAEGQVMAADAESMSDSLLRLTNAGNAFFGTNIILKDDDRFIAHQTSRPGIPDTRVQTGAEYEAALAAHYTFDRIAPATVKSKADQMLVVPQTRDPLQPLMLKSVNWTLPIVASCAAPKPDRSIRRVCVWWASTDYGELEQRWVSEVFKRKGIDIRSPTNKSKDQFTRLYKAGDVDVIWMIGHGRFDHYYPENMSIDLSETDELTFEDWQRIELTPGEERRLFVANLCDSGTTAILGGTGELGLPLGL